MTRIGIRFPLVSALLLAILTVEREALSHDVWHEAEIYNHCIEIGGKPSHDEERPIDVLSALVQRKPDDADYQMMLNHACVSPLASVHCATPITKMVV